MPAARAAADRLVEERTGVIVLLGAKVRQAFDGPEPFAKVQNLNGTLWLVGLPHPSGLCRVWHEPDAIERARAVLRSAAPDIPWGSDLS